MAATWVLPVTTLTVVSSSGGILATALRHHSMYHALLTTVVSVFLVTIGLSLGLMILTVYLARLIIYGLPPGASIISVFLPLGTTGQSGYALTHIGTNFKEILPYGCPGTSPFLGGRNTGQVLEVVCLGTAFVLWSLATMWMIFALLALKNTILGNYVPFHISFWGLVFPNVSQRGS
jgi:tellurite resistance protein TehA-like permease